LHTNRKIPFCYISELFFSNACLENRKNDELYAQQLRFCHCDVNEYTFDIFAHIMASALQLGTCIIDINKLSADHLVYKDASDGFKLDSKRL